MSKPVDLLTQKEVAERLRCSEQKVKRLRKIGALAYIPGRPVLIDEADLGEYLSRIKRQSGPAAAKPVAIKPVRPPESPAALARRVWLARQNFQRDKQDRAKIKK
ncbi:MULTISPECIES: helix-turn-helix domain-containing protein [unclassified Mesorhizobium]|uniref:helix-turn-helix domain-containing protein n=1 Tax=unclassified Mesorhizobium TaxID=325217 RepID=UPI00241764F2|nr:MULTISPECIES: helix-turn-helix domain-containing protein [unclassified Mesorhizobium]MDG4903496.1 helix-turn-helix domain-containing protein [Mesorhizobium sp. WSM4962]MDG4921454.1 helix-turn-helix domain-containing protein [Mesorhizobium sp. WSM4989]